MQGRLEHFKAAFTFFVMYRSQTPLTNQRNLWKDIPSCCICFHYLVIGAEEKTKIIIKKGSSQISAESYVLSSSNVDEFSDFWISWLDGNLCIGEFENYKYKDAIVCANDEGDYNFRWAGFKGDWLDYIAYYSFEYSVCKHCSFQLLTL